MRETVHDAVASASTSDDASKTIITSLCLPCAPVTALEFLSPSKLLVAAQGPALKLFDIQRPNDPLSEVELWSFQRIHGIVRYPYDGNSTQERLLVFGGKHAALVHGDREGQVKSM